MSGTAAVTATGGAENRRLSYLVRPERRTRGRGLCFSSCSLPRSPQGWRQDRKLAAFAP